MLIDLLGKFGGHWIFTAPPDKSGTGQAHLPGNIWLHPITLPEETRRHHYDTISIGLFLRLMHYMYDTSGEPVFDEAMLDAWGAYEEVSKVYAKRLAEIADNEPDECILINDPHLMMVPAHLASEFPSRSSRLTYFLGTPWCEPDYFSVLPAWLRTRILESLLLCDVVGFHAGRWADAFLACCDRFLPGADVAGRTVRYGGRMTRVVASPFPVDAEILGKMRLEPATRRWERRLTEMAQGRRILLRADRLDLWKNLPRGFAAYERLLQRRPALADECWFGAVVSVPSRATSRHRAYQELTQTLVQRINERFGRPGKDAISLIFPAQDDGSRHCVVAGLGMSHAALVNSTYDGLNLFAKEAALLMGDHARLLLSVNAGVYEQLGPYAIPVDPFDLDQTSAAIEKGLDGAGGPSAGRASVRREFLRAESADAWLRSVFP